MATDHKGCLSITSARKPFSSFFKEFTRGNCVLLTRWWGCSYNSGRFLLGVSDLLGNCHQDPLTTR